VTPVTTKNASPLLWRRYIAQNSRGCKGSGCGQFLIEHRWSAIYIYTLYTVEIWLVRSFERKRRGTNLQR
jgi:hypothetical protein